MKDLDKNISFESMLGDSSTKLVNLPLESLDTAIEYSMKSLVEFFEADPCHLGKISDKQPKILKNKKLPYNGKTKYNIF